MEGIHLFIMVVAMSNSLLFFVKGQGNAFNSNINSCLFDGWSTGASRVLSSKVQCGGRELAGLCYGLKQRGKPTATFAVCYSKTKLIPEFSGHVVSVRGGDQAAGRDDFRNEAGVYAPNPQSDWESDYDTNKQKSFVLNFNRQQLQFYGRGHLTPKSAFSTFEELALTMVNTNIAPQWQRFNSQNWATLEEAVRKYSKRNERSVYVFTGTGGSLTRQENGQQVPLKLNGRVLVPRYFWKAVCDPVAKRSVVFLAQNPTGAEGDQKKNGCSLNIPNFRQQPMTQVHGIIFCYSLEALRGFKEARLFKLPPFSDNCSPSVRGEFLDEYLRHLN